AGPGDRGLVAQDRGDATAVRAGTDQGGERFGVRLGTERRERPGVTRRQYPPAGLACGPELLHQDRGPRPEQQADHGALRLRLLRRLLDVDPAALRQVDQQTRVAV